MLSRKISQISFAIRLLFVSEQGHTVYMNNNRITFSKQTNKTDWHIAVNGVLINAVVAKTTGGWVARDNTSEHTFISGATREEAAQNLIDMGWGSSS